MLVLPSWALDILIGLGLLVGAVFLYFVAKMLVKLLLAYIIMVIAIVILKINLSYFEWILCFAVVFVVFFTLSLFNK
jgi:hypothetical protein